MVNYCLTRGQVMWTNKEVLEMLSTDCLKKLRNYIAKGNLKSRNIPIEEIDLVITERTDLSNAHSHPNKEKSS